jgi:hypothetical protein
LPLKRTGPVCSRHLRSVEAVLDRRLIVVFRCIIYGLIQLGTGCVAYGNDLPSTIQALRQTGRVFVPSSFYAASCDAHGCRTNARERTPLVGSLVRRDPSRPGGYMIPCFANGDTEYTVQTPRYAAARTVALPYDEGSLIKLFGSEPESAGSADLIKSLARHLTLEARDIYTEIAFSEKDLRSAIFSLPLRCRAEAYESKSPASIIVERTFGTIVLKATIKEELGLDELKNGLLEVQKLVQPRFQARIGSRESSREKLLEISTRDIRLFSFRTTPLEALKISHKDWFE